MPVLTPSRLAAVVLSLSLLTFLWTFGLPQSYPQLSFPPSNHDTPAQGAGAEKALDGEKSPFDAQDEGSILFHASDPLQTSGRIPSPSLVKTSFSTAIKAQQTAVKEANAESQHGEKKPESKFAHPSSIPVLNATALSASTPAPSPIKSCKDVPGAPNVMVIVKTSKAEINEKLPAHLKTLLACVPNFAIFSDHSGKIDGFTVHDALDTISNTTRSSRDEFRDYEKMRLDPQWTPTSVTKELDKWKFLPMVYKTFKMHSYARFYVFIEADTSLSWTNLLQWIDRLDYRIPYYSGAPTYLGSNKFAQRGSGILLSSGAMRQYAKLYEERYESEWEARVANECCGDLILATAMMESHVEFYSAFPLLQGETPQSLDWIKSHWCSPIVSWHHMTPSDIENVWARQESWTKTHGWGVPYLTKNAFEDFVMPNLKEKLEGWDNISSDTKIQKPLEPEMPKQPEEEKALNPPSTPPEENPQEGEKTKPKAEKRKRDTMDWDSAGESVQNAPFNPDACQALCQQTEDCLQWKYTQPNDGNGECHLGKVIRLGKKVDKKGEDGGWTSGWMMDRVAKETKEWSNCKEAAWKFNQGRR